MPKSYKNANETNGCLVFIAEVSFLIAKCQNGLKNSLLEISSCERKSGHEDYHTHEDHRINFQTFFVWALLLIVYTWNSSPIRSNLLLAAMHLLYRSNNFWEAPWKSSYVSVSMTSSQPLSSPQLSHNDSLWAKGITKMSQGGRSGL